MKALALLGLLFASAAQASWLEIVPDKANGLYNVGDVPQLFIKVGTAPTNPAYHLELFVTPEGGSAVAVPILAGRATYTGAALAVGEREYQVQLKLLGPSTSFVLRGEGVTLEGR